MGNQNNPPVVKKKVQPYPIEGSLELNAVKKPVAIDQVNLKGAIVHLKGPLVFVGEYYELDFEFPVIHSAVRARVRVIKTYDRVLDKEIHVERMAEIHFQNLSPENRARIQKFLEAIGQTT